MAGSAWERALRLPVALALAAAAGCSAAASPAEQSPPVQFSHQLHATENAIGCVVCHPYARHSPNAGLAPGSVCIGCHKFVATDKPDIVKLTAEYEAGRALTWGRNHRLPDHVFFSHERHLAKQIACAECHGEVARMGIDRRVKDLTMGFCLGCHQKNGGPTDCLACHK
jgi:Cytochrome c7 and related cytochrome c